MLIIKPDMLQRHKAKFSESITERSVFGDFSVGDLPYHIEDGIKRGIDYVMITSSICKQQ